MQLAPTLLFTMLSRTSAPSFLVPTVLALAAGFPLAAQDGVAPVIIFPANDPRLTSAPAPAEVNSLGAIFSLASAPFTSDMYVFQAGQGNGSQLPFSGLPNTLNGIAVVAISGQGQWQYSVNSGDTWNAIANVSEDTVLNIPLCDLIRFVPDSYADYAATAQLSFRAVDNVNTAGTTTINNDPLATTMQGGSPTAFSTEIRTLLVPMSSVNDAPVWGNSATDLAIGGSAQSYATTYALNSTGGGRPIVVTVAELVGHAGAVDPDSTSDGSLVPGILLTDLNIGLNDFVIEHRDSFTGQWVPFTLDTESSSNAVHVGATDTLRLTPRGVVNANRSNLFAFTYRLWDGTGIYLEGDYISGIDLSSGSSTPYSTGYGAVVVPLTANVAPVIVNSSSVVVINPGQASATLAISARDVDGEVVKFGIFAGQNGFDARPLDMNGTHLQWLGVRPETGGVTNTLQFSPVAWVPGQGDSFTVAAQDDLGDVTDVNNRGYVTLYGNSAPVYDLGSEVVAAGLSIDSRAAQPLIVTFTVHDADVDTTNRYPMWSDMLNASVVAANSSGPLRGNVSVLATHVSGQLQQQLLVNRSAIITTQPGGYTTLTLSYTPDLTTLASYNDNFKITVTDSNGAFADLLGQVAVGFVNHAPLITAPINTSLGTVVGGTAKIVTASATDEDGGSLTWSVKTPPAFGTVTTAVAVGASVSYAYTPLASYSGADSFTLQVSDSSGATAEVTLGATVTAPPSINHPPVITAPTPLTSLGSVLGGTSYSLTATATDQDNDLLTWSVQTVPAHGTLTVSNQAGAGAVYVYTPVVGYSGIDSFALQVSDTSQANAQVVVTATVVGNTPPVLVSTIGTGGDGQVQTPITVLAIAGQGFEALITGGDSETPQNVQMTITGTTPDGITFTTSGSGKGMLEGIPTTPGIYDFTITLDDGVNLTVRHLSMTVVMPVLANVPPQTIPVSSPGHTAYGSFLPGSSSNFQAVATILASRPASESRAFWWDGAADAYVELPVLPSMATRGWHALWLASVTPVTLPAAIPAVAMPYAIDLLPGWTFFGLPPVTDGTTVSIVHNWANCSLQSAAGVPLSVTERAAVLGNADSAGPWAWDGTIYARSTSLATGRGYWLYNGVSQPVRLVRGSTAALSPSATRAVAASQLMRATGQAADNEQPPLPPSGASSTKAESSNGCGTGSGMSLFTLAGLLALVRFRRR